MRAYYVLRNARGVNTSTDAHHNSNQARKPSPSPIIVVAWKKLLEAQATDATSLFAQNKHPVFEHLFDFNEVVDHLLLDKRSEKNGAASWCDGGMYRI